MRWAQALAGDLKLLAVLPHRHHFARRRFQHHGRHQVAVVWGFFQGFVNRIFQVFDIGGQGDKFFRTAVNLTPLKIHDALTQGFVGRILVHRIQRGEDVHAAGVSLVAVLGVNQLTHSFGHIFGVDFLFVRTGADVQDFRFGFFGLRGGDEFILQHALNDVLLTHGGPLGIADGVVGRGRFGQTRQHGGFSNGDVFQRFAKVGLRGRGKAISPVAQENLIHVDFQDLVLGQHVFQLEGQQDFVNLAGVGFLGGQVHIARHLHGDGRGALALALAQVGQSGPHDAQIIDAAMLVKAGVFDRQHRVLHDLRDFVDRCEVATLLTKFANQIPLGGENAQRQFGAVLGQIRDVWQIGVGHDQGHARDQDQGQHTCHTQSDNPQQDADQPMAGRDGWAIGLGGCVLR